jgi:hypothetical protein
LRELALDKHSTINLSGNEDIANSTTNTPAAHWHKLFACLIRAYLVR